MAETRYQRITREQEERQAAREERARKPRKRAKGSATLSPSNDPDGLWRDNLGESPDW